MIKDMLSVGTSTMLSRIFGFARDFLISNLIGLSVYSDVFFAAFRFPNLFRRIFAEGSLTSSVAPIYSRIRQKSEQEAEVFRGDIVSSLLLILLLFTSIMEIFMPGFVYFITPGFADDPIVFWDTVFYSRILFWYLLLVSTSSLVGVILNSHGYFFFSTLAPIFLNLFLILVLVYFKFFAVNYITSDIILFMSIAVILSGGAHLAIVCVQVRQKKIKIKLKFKFPKKSNNLSELFYFMLPSLASSSITQINIVVGTIFASTISEGISVLYFADRIYQLPLGLITAMIGFVVLPYLVNAVIKQERENIKHIQEKSFLLCGFLSIPFAFAGYYLGYEVVLSLFQYNNFTIEDAYKTSEILKYYLLGLPAFLFLKVLNSIFYSNKDSKVPLWASVFNLGVNISLIFILFDSLGIYAIPISTVCSSWINVFILYFIGFERKYLLLSVRTVVIYLLKLIIAAFLMTYVLDQLMFYLQFDFEATASFFLRFGHILLLTFVGFVSFCLFNFVLKTSSMSDIRYFVRLNRVNLN